MNVNVPLSLNTYPVAFNHVTTSENPVIATITLPLVTSIVEYIHVAVGAVLSIQSTVAVMLPVFPSPSSK
jgi:hypothetical protein